MAKGAAATRGARSSKTSAAVRRPRGATTGTTTGTTAGATAGAPAAHGHANAPGHDHHHHDVAHDVAHDVVGCGCGVPHGDESGRKAVAVDAAGKDRNLKRLRRIEGQVRGIQKMVEEDRYCADVVTQVSAVHEALRSVSRELMRNHLKHCTASAVRGTPEAAESMYDELVDMMFKHSR